MKEPRAVSHRAVSHRKDGIQQKGFRIQELWISTTLLDPIAYPAEQVAALSCAV
jgi:hypothetical protein